jgi:hypothetical protein
MMSEEQQFWFLAREYGEQKATIERYREALKEARAAVRIHHHPDCVCVNCAALESESER